MHYIVVDFEWNQPISSQSSIYRKIGDKLIFEMIQIGAVRVGPDFQPSEQISIPIAPTYYVRIHPRIRKMTGLGPDELAGAPDFNEAMDRFMQWCGEDCVLLTWGCDDISVLKQNMDFFECRQPLPMMCDIQRLFSNVHQQKDRMGLKTAMELAGIEEEEDRSFHNAVHDAWYTAKVFGTLPDPDEVLKYEQTPKALNRNRHHDKEKTPGEVFATLADALASETATRPVCPRCGRDAALEPGGYVPQSADKYIALAKCKQHGKLLIRLSFRVDDDGNRVMHRSVFPATGANVAYVHTKKLQIEARQAQYLEENGCLPDPEKELLEAERTSMPFDD
ncbi:MAG: exonuclease domain-containing protein [Clostridia bacterium]|nr:exonuclease domain-containing protein [Clostridia bacterium]